MKKSGKKILVCRSYSKYSNFILSFLCSPPSGPKLREEAGGALIAILPPKVF